MCCLSRSLGKERRIIVVFFDTIAIEACVNVYQYFESCYIDETEVSSTAVTFARFFSAIHIGLWPIDCYYVSDYVISLFFFHLVFLKYLIYLTDIPIVRQSFRLRSQVQTMK
jgi:hypothetical protein